MKKTVMTAIAVCIIGCGDDANAKETVSEIQSTPNVIMVENTTTISYHLYRQAWRKANNMSAQPWDPKVTATVDTHKDREIVEVELNDLKFKDAFRLEFLGKGEGHTFWWRGNEYTTNLLDVIRKPDFKHTDPFIERVVPTTITPVPVDREDLREGGGDQGTTE